MITTANPTQFEAWNGDSGRRWVASADRRDQVLAPVADVLLTEADAAPGHRVLDLGCGCGATTLAAATLVGDAGHATGIDLSQPMLEIAARRARTFHGAIPTFIHGDSQTHPFEPGRTDLAISRFGTMFFSDPVAAFTNIAAALSPAGRLCIATWQPLVANEWLTVPGAALLHHADLPDTSPDEPGMFAQSDPDIIEATLTAAGFDHITVEAADVTFTLGQTVDDAVEHLADSGPGRALLETIPPGREHDAALHSVSKALLPHHRDRFGVQLRGAVWITSATKTA